MELFQVMIQISLRNRKDFPVKYINDMVKMYGKCSVEKQKSKKLIELVMKAIECIPQSKDGFQYIANVYNELLELCKKDSTSLPTEIGVASTSGGSSTACISSEIDNKTSCDTISKNTEIFNEFIEKCYQNKNFPKSNIEAIEKLYRSLPSEFLDTKDFGMLLKEANQVIWPDSVASSYVHVEHIYDQLLQFEMSMKIQDSKTSLENNEVNLKKQKKLKKLKNALKTVRKKIKILEEKEMDINNEDEFDENSAYILKDRYEKRILEIYKRICKITEEPDFLEEPKLSFKGTTNKIVNKTIEKFYNLNKTFPDYFEIHTLLKLLQEKKKFNWSELELKNISQDAFLKLGKQLKLRRLNEYFGRLAPLTTETDPAENNLELKKKLDESNKKLHADLNAITEKYINIQDYAEETEGSSLNNTECENSSDDDCINKNQSILNKKFQTPKSIPIKRKKELSNELEKNEPVKKSQKTVYMESFNLTPCSVTLRPLSNLVVETNAEQVTEKVLDCETENTKIIDEKSGNNSVSEESFSDINGKLVIDEDIEIDDDADKSSSKTIQENEGCNVESDEKTSEIMNTSVVSIDSEDNEPMITEPEVIISEGRDVGKDVIEINEFDDSDVEITSCDTPIVPVQNKKTLESIIKSMNFNQKYNWNKAQNSIQKPVQKPPIPNILISRPPLGFRNQWSYNQNQNNFNHNLVNRWIVNNQQSHHSNRNRFIRPQINNRLPSLNHRMQSSFHKSTTERQFTHRFSNSVQQRNFMNNQSVLQQRVTTMTTTTTVRKIVQQSAESGRHRPLNAPTNQNHRSASFQSNNKGNPELIELD